MSTRSVRCATASRNAPTWSGSRTSQGCAKHRSPSSSATAAIGSGRRPQIATVPPAATIARAVAAPIPVPPPVTIADAAGERVGRER